MYKIEQLGTAVRKIILGQCGENLANEIQIDVSKWLEKCPDANFSISVIRPDEELPYLAASTLNGNILTWTPDAGDTALPGVGKMEICAVSGGRILKTPVVVTQVYDCLYDDDPSDPPEAAQGWLAQLRDTQAYVEQAVDNVSLAEQNTQEYLDESRQISESFHGIEVTEGTPVHPNTEMWVDPSKQKSVRLLEDTDVDTSLSMPGKAADAAATGEKIKQVQDSTNESFSQLKDDIVNIAKTEDGFYTLNPDLVDGYVDYTTGSVSNWAGTETSSYKRTDYLIIDKLASEIHYDARGTSNINAHYATALYDKDKNFIEGTLRTTNSKSYTEIPENAVYIVISTKNIVGNVTLKYKILKIIDNLSERVKALEDLPQITPQLVTCYGDSTVEGMNMSDAGFANYGGDTMPSHLLTLLKDNGYNITVENMGHGGERSTEVCARVGGRYCAYLSEDITIPVNNPMVSLGVASVANYKVTGSKMESVGLNTDGTNAKLLLTQTGRHTRPALIGSYEVNIFQSNAAGGVEQFVQLVTKQGKDITLPKYSPIVFGNSKRNSKVNIVHMGINDGVNLTLNEWIDRCKSIIEVEPKTIICGLYNGFWRWIGIEGSTNTEKYEKYLRTCLSNFGAYFVNLYDVFCTDRCIKIAQDGGYLTDRTDAQIESDNTAFANGHTCPSLTYDGTENNVHFNSIGYYVFAKVLYDKILSLGLLDK